MKRMDRKRNDMNQRVKKKARRQREGKQSEGRDGRKDKL
jgi:hypothetical protein